MSKSDRSVVRNEAYQKKSVSIRERHNERMNETYYNSDIQLDRKHLNVYFKQSEKSYTETYDAMLAAGIITEKGLKKDGTAKVIDEMIFDVNTEYFDKNGGYEYAKSFFEETYRCAVNEVGGEEYILSAVMHADERNKALSEQLGRDVYHYHLHVIYIPVVDKDVLWTKKCKDLALVGTVKEVIKQVSHSKKWPRFKTEKGLVNSYSLLQDRFHDHMKQAGFIGFERGEKGATTEHLDVLDYKIQQDEKRLDALESSISDKTVQVEKKQERIKELDETIAVKDKAAATVAEIEAMGKPALLGSNLIVTADDMKTLKTLAKKSVTADKKVMDMRNRLIAVETERDTLKAEKVAVKKAEPTISEHLTWFNKFITALRRAPKRLMAVIEDILRKPPEKQEPDHTTPEKKRGINVDR